VAGSISLLRIEQVRTAAGLRDFAGVLAANWEPPDEEILRFYAATGEESLANGSGQRFFVGYLEETAVTVCELFLGPAKRVGLYGVATREGYRRRGYGTALLRLVLETMRAAGVLEVLVHSEVKHESFYRKLGFEVIPGRPGDGAGEMCLCYRLGDAAKRCVDAPI
jgi:ribosomal protein S18 acetylase RimI-like enzyme